MADIAMTDGSASHLLRQIGSWGRPGTSGRGLYMFRSMVVASSTAAIVGVGFAAASGILTGSGVMGFLVGSSLGFVGASIHYYQMSLRQALVTLDEFPGLMQLHLAYNFPWLGYQRLSPRQMTTPAYWRSSLSQQGNLIAAWQSASNSLDDIFERRAQLLIEDLAARNDRSETGEKDDQQ